ncbi:MAG TPA: hypothetical protein VE909_12405 [Xanthobacteraceae bacterium]|nr:hypothetical protein [Myxococcaceae bacterium]HKD44900.1 hypothetical protein [Candidatus Angelobacter sp.]HYW61325.1 hypothetical protein [Xanthobacteraceae bacterium]
MPTKRAILARPRRVSFTPEMLALFAELEAVPARERERAKWIGKSKQLAGLLGLTSEWWTMNDVNDKNATPCVPDGYVAFDDWHTCRRVRLALLDAIGGEAVDESD